VGSTVGQLFKSFEAGGGPQIKLSVKDSLRIKMFKGVVSLKKTGNLSCNQVILTNCCKWDNGKGAAEKVSCFHYTAY
jgi:hypothetical protein